MSREQTKEDEYRLALEDCYMIARRRLVALNAQTNIDELIINETRAWQFVVKFCERAGLRSNILRAMETPPAGAPPVQE